MKRARERVCRLRLNRFWLELKQGFTEPDVRRVRVLIASGWS